MALSLFIEILFYHFKGFVHDCCAGSLIEGVLEDMALRSFKPRL